MSLNIVMLLSNPVAGTYRDPRVCKEAKSLIREGHAVTILGWDRECKYRAEEIYEGIKLKRIQARSRYGSSIFQIPALIKFLTKALIILRNEHFDIIHCHDIETLPAGYILSRWRKVPLIFDAHETDYGTMAHKFNQVQISGAKLIEKLFVSKADRVVVAHRYSISKYKKMGAKKIYLVPNYPERSLLDKKFRVSQSENRINIGRIGALHADAGIEELIDAYKLLSKENHAIRLFIAGHGDKEMRRIIQEKIRYNSDGIIVQFGYESNELPTLYAKANFSVFPDKPSGWRKDILPTKFFESLALEVPVITTDVGGTGTIVKTEQCGVLIEKVMPEVIVDAIKIFLNNPNLLKQMGENGRRAVAEKYNWDISAEVLLAAYRSLEFTDSFRVKERT